MMGQADPVTQDYHECPLVTVEVSVYNQASYIKECLDSIVETRYPNLELILINDASQDNSNEIIQQWINDHGDQEIIYIDHDQNVGLTRSLNEAIRLCNGVYFYPIAGDDVVLPKGITNLVDYLMQHPDKLAVFGDCHVINEEGRQLYESGVECLFAKFGRRKTFLSIDELIPSSIIFDWPIFGSVFMCRTETFNIVGLYDETLLVDDWDMYLRIAALKKIGFCNCCVAKYRLYPHNLHLTNRYIKDWSITSRNHIRLFRGIEALHLKVWSRIWQYSLSKSFFPKVLWFFGRILAFVLDYLYYVKGLVVLLKHKCLVVSPINK